MRPQARFVLLVFLAVAGLNPSVRAADLDNLLTGYAITSWSDGDGRPLGAVYAIVQDGDGYLWVGTDSRLLRFDGSRFTDWNTSNTPLPAVSVRALTVGRDGSLWVGLDEGAGVRQIRNGTLLPPAPGLPGVGAISDLVEDQRGVVWAIADRALYRLQADGWRRVSLPWRAREGFITQPYVGPSGDLFVGTRWGVFRRGAGADGFELVTDDYVWSISEGPDGTVFTTDIVAAFKRLDAPAPAHELEGSGFRLMHDSQGSLWIATFGEGLWRVRNAGDTGRQSVERATLRTGLLSDSVQSLAEDREGNIWAGTTGGLHRLTRRKLTPVENVGFVVVMEQAENGQMWAGTTNGLVKFSAVPGRWAGQTTPGPDARVMYREPNGTLWIGSSDGLWRASGGRLSRVPLPTDQPMLILSIAPDGQGGLWLGDGEWLFRWDGTRVSRFEAPSDLPHRTRITFARADRRGRVWIGFSGNRLGYLEKRGLSLLGPAEGFRDEHRTIYGLLEDGDGVVWIAGSGGLSRFAHGRIATLDRRNGLPADRVWAVVEDSRRDLWLTVDRGILRIRRNDMARWEHDPAHRVQYRLFDSLDGLAGAAIGIIGSARGTDGTLWFVRGGGVTHLDPAGLIDDPTPAPAPVRIEAVVANDRNLSPTATSSLSPGTTRLQIDYTALKLTSSTKIRFRYQLNGFDTTWVDAGTRRTAFYTNLSPGTYQFRVEASAENEPWSASATAWDFTIRPAFYQTNWFIAVGLAALGFSVWATWRFRIGLVRRQFSLALAERARLSREIHDTLLQSLVGVALQFDAISNSLGPSSDGARAQLTRIRREVEAYIREARQSIWDLRSPLLETRDLPTALREFGRNAVAQTASRFVATTSGTPRECSPKIENQLLRIGQEAITNAVRHSGAARITLELKFDSNAVTLRVSDDGRGFDDSYSTIEPDRHYGLTTMRERAAELGAQFRIATAVGQGTEVETVVPTRPGALEDAAAEA